MLLVLVALQSPAFAQSPGLTDDLVSLDKEIVAAEQESQRYAGGLLKAILDVRIATLKHTRAMLDQKVKAKAAGIALSYTVAGKPFALPANSAEQLSGIEQELAALDTKIAAQEAEAARYSGGRGRSRSGTDRAKRAPSEQP